MRKDSPLGLLVLAGATVFAAGCSNGSNPSATNIGWGFVYVEAPSTVDASFAYGPNPSSFPATDQCVLEKVQQTGAMGSLELASAGRIEIAAGANTVEVDLADGGIGALAGGDEYSSTGGNAALFSAGQILGIHAEGDVVPAFTGSVEVPSPLVVTTPSGPSSTVNPIPIPTNAAYAMTWSGGGGTVIVALVATPWQLTCAYDGSTGRGILPSQELQAFLQSAQTTSAGLTFNERNQVPVSVAGWSVDLEAAQADGVGFEVVLQ